MSHLFRSIRVLSFLSRRFSTLSPKEKAAKISTGVTVKSPVGGGDTLGRRLFSLVYSKRSAVIAINKWKEEGHTVRKYELNRIVRELRKLKRYKHALEICEWMTLQKDIKLQPGDYAVHLDLIAKVRGLNSAEKFFEDIPEKMAGPHACNALLHVYVQNQLVSKAEAVMQKMSECGFLENPVPYNNMLSLYISIGKLEKVQGMIEELKMNTSPDTVTYNLWLTYCASQKDVETAEKVFLEMKKAKIDPDWVTYSSLSNVYIRNALFQKAALILQKMEKKCTRKTRAAFSSLLSLHTNMGNKDEVHRIWKKMKLFFPKMNDAEYTCMISSLLKLGDIAEAENVYREWESINVTRDVRIPNLLFASYIKQDQMEMAESFKIGILEKGFTPSYTTYELLTWGYLKRKNTEEVLDYLKKAIGSVREWSPDEKLVKEILRNLEEQAHIKAVEQLLVILRNAGYVNTVIYNSLLRTYAKAGKMPLLVTERMEKDKVPLDEETHSLIALTSKMCVSDVSSVLS